ncbi:MAG: ABC transporter ATP-binding protein [Dehalococcoidaceae bacterium]|nr:ABC transporter ATP-binding protein [Dehalococcoidaceae bacterium]
MKTLTSDAVPAVTAAVAIDNLSFNYGRLRVIDGLSLEVGAGTSFGLLGPNGSGKTTLIRLMVGLLKPAGGTIHCLGRPPSPARARNMGYMPQLPALYQELSVEQNIEFFARIYGMKDKRQRSQRVEEVIRLVDLWSRRKTSVLKLSGGMKQRVSLGCAIVHRPPLLFLDEPTVGLDPELRAHFWRHFENLTAAGTTLIISSHTMDDAAHCRQLVFMRQGKIIAKGSPAELQAATGDGCASLEDAFLYFIRKGKVPTGDD